MFSFLSTIQIQTSYELYALRGLVSDFRMELLLVHQKKNQTA